MSDKRHTPSVLSQPEAKDEESITVNSPEYTSIPKIVRDTVSFEDEPRDTTVTFRVIILSTLFCCVGSFVGIFRTTSANFSVFFVILMAWPLGKMMEQMFPMRSIGIGKWKFSLNPGPFSGKEHVLIGLASNAGAQGMSSSFFAANAKIFYDIDVNPATALFFGWSTQIIGFSFAAITRQILIQNPAFIFPVSLQQVKLYRSIQNRKEALTQRRQMKGFWIICGAIFVWQFFPEFIFPMTASLAPLCWISRNKTVNFIGSGIGGIGVLSMTLDWSNISSSVITQPWFVQVNLFVGFVISTWILIPLACFGNIWGSPTYSVMSNGVFTKNGSEYPFQAMSELLLAEDLCYDEVGLAYTGAQYRWDFFFWYAAYVSAFVWMFLFSGPEIYRILKARFTNATVSDDRLSGIMRFYPEVSPWEWLVLFFGSFITIVVLVLKGHLYMPLFTLFVGLAFGAAATLPMSLIYAVSGFVMNIGVFNELVYGYMLDVPGSSRHPLGQLAYRIVSGHVWYDIQTLIEDQKIGHYMHIPPRSVVFSQLYGSFLGFLVSCSRYGIMRWILETKIDYLRNIKKDPNGQWTGQEQNSYNTNGVQFALIGPQRLFQDAMYKPLPYAGVLVPLVIWLLHRKFKGPKFHLWNTAIFFSNMAEFRGNISTGALTGILCGFIWSFWLLRYHYKFWNMWAYVSGAACMFSTGFNLNLLVLFMTVGAADVTMPNWWGNNAESVERCFHKEIESSQ
ncbi:OPT oligopeptide transporter [Mycena floridula]|nr:OPT oligopeptide transporter [Mycena floridula]